MNKMDEHIITGPEVSQETLRNTDQSLSEYLIKTSSKYLDKVLMTDAETEDYVTCKDILDKSYKIASFLRNNDCSKETVVGIVCENSFEYLSLLLATLHVGATCTCINPLYATNELLHALSISKPKLIFASSKTYKNVQSIQQQCDYLSKVVNVDKTDYFAYDDANNQYKNTNNNDSKIDPTDTAVIMYSSGTTGLSKGVMLTHKSFIYLMEMYRTEKLLNFPENVIISGLLPMSHAYGLFSLISCLALGHHYIMIKRYNEKSFLNYIQKYKINTLYIVPSIAIFLSKSPVVKEYDLSSVSIISCGGGVLRPEIAENIKKFVKCNFLQHYGMTETTTMNLYSSPFSKVGVTGQLLPGMMAKIVDIDTGLALDHYKKGEYCVKGPLLMKGYCKSVTNDNPIDSDGWLHTGDIGYYDEDHDFFIIDRIKELIKYKGFQVPPAELEMLILQHPHVTEVGVVGLPDEEAGELPRAYIVKKADSRVTEDDILQYVASNISPMKKLRGGVKFVSQLPKTVSGKVDRKELKKWAASEIMSR